MGQKLLVFILKPSNTKDTPGVDLLFVLVRKPGIHLSFYSSCKHYLYCSYSVSMLYSSSLLVLYISACTLHLCSLYMTVSLLLLYILYSGLMPSYVKYLKTSQIELAVFEIWVNSGVFDSLFKIWELFYIKWCKKFGDLILLCSSYRYKMVSGKNYSCSAYLCVNHFTVSVVLQIMP